ncbi:MAG: hypothetical protein ACR2P3_03100, partial [Geminicoccaceae bacterium]
VAVMPLPFKAIGKIVNWMGPLIGPHRVFATVAGASSSALFEAIAASAKLLERRMLVVASEAGADELIASGANRCVVTESGATWVEHCGPFSKDAMAGLAGGDLAFNKARLEAILEGKDSETALATVAMNAGAALLMAGYAVDIKDGEAKARQAIASGAALDRLRAAQDHVARATRPSDRSIGRSGAGGNSMSPSFRTALEQARIPLIAEVKPFSPERGDLLRGRSVGDIAKAYADAGAVAISVTTGRWHEGKLDMLGEAAASGLPVLRKDFITTRQDLEKSQEAGAAAVLLTCRLLRVADLVALAGRALDAGLTPFVEAADEDELRALDMVPEGAVVAVNNRDIRTRETDKGGVDVSLALFQAARAVTKGPVVSASGLRSPAAASTAITCGYDAVLVGTALLLDPRGIDTATRAYVRAIAADSVLT